MLLSENTIYHQLISAIWLTKKITNRICLIIAPKKRIKRAILKKKNHVVTGKPRQAEIENPDELSRKDAEIENPDEPERKKIEIDDNPDETKRKIPNMHK
jgi:UDP-N-acetylglucosamine:LPS N-acetylglucosamine transferase